MCNEARMDFSVSEYGGKLTALFTDTGISGMLEAKDYENVDLVWSFFGEVVDVCCSNTKDALIIDFFTQYVNVVQTIRKQNCRPGWTKNKLLDLQQQIDRFNLFQ